MSSTNVKQADDGGYDDDDDLSALDVKPEYHTGRPTYTCPRCDKQFLYASQMRQHVRFHLKHRPFRCPVCSKTFVQSSNLTEHFRIHTDERPFKCELCKRRFRQSSNLNYHIRSAHGQANTASMATVGGDSTTAEKSKRSEPKLFSCEHCDRKFAHPCRLTRHARIHSKDSPYQCQFCQKTFNYSSNLLEHVRIHTGERPYVCAMCGHSFAQSSQLKVHVKARHPDADSDTSLLVVCSICGLHFNGLRALRNHLKLHGTDSRPFSKHSKRSATKTRPSQKLLPSTKYLERLVKSVTERGGYGDRLVGFPYVCCYCELGFKTAGRLVMHLWSHEDGESVQSLTNINIKTESDSSSTDVEDAVEVKAAVSQPEGRWSRRSNTGRQLCCPHCSKQFVHRRKWKAHVQMHEAQRIRSGNRKRSGEASRTKRGVGLASSYGLRGTVDQPAEGKDASALAVKVENGGSDRHDTSLDVYSDGDDNTEQFDPVPGSDSRQRSEESPSMDSIEKLLAAVMATGGRRRRSTKKKSKPATAAARSRTYPCNLCDRVMASAAALHYHRRTHTGVKPFACSVCPRRFIIRGQLVEHERIHSGEKPFACDQCPKRFAQSSQLRQHASIHSVVGTHVCPTCGEAFTRPWRLQSHRRAAHAEDDASQKRYRCDDCGREYSLRQSWVYHRLTHSSDRPFQCDVCSRQFRVIGQLRQHVNHCRGRRTAQPQTTAAADPYNQPPQNWIWFSESTSDLIAETIANSSAVDVARDTSVFDSSVAGGGGATTQELTTTDLHHL